MTFTILDYFWVIGHILAAIAILTNQKKFRSYFGYIILLFLIMPMLSDGSNDLLHYYNYVNGRWFNNNFYNVYLDIIEFIFNFDTEGLLLSLRVLILISIIMLIKNLGISKKGAEIFLISIALSSLGFVLVTNNNLRQGFSLIILCHVYMTFHNKRYYLSLFLFFFSLILHKYALFINPFLVLIYILSKIKPKFFGITSLFFLSYLAYIYINMYYQNTEFLSYEITEGRGSSYIKWCIIFIIWILSYSVARNYDILINLRTIRIYFLIFLIPFLPYQEFSSRFIFISYIFDGLYLIYGSYFMYKDNFKSFGLLIIVLSAMFAPQAFFVIR